MSSQAAGKDRKISRWLKALCCLLRPSSSHQSAAAAGSKSQQALWQSSGACMTWKHIENAQMTWKCTQVGCKASLHGRKTGTLATAIRPGNSRMYLKRVGLACQIWLWDKILQHRVSFYHMLSPNLHYLREFPVPNLLLS